MQTGTRVKRATNTDIYAHAVKENIRAYIDMRGTVLHGGRYNVLVCVLWDCDKAAGHKDGTWIPAAELELDQ